MHDALDVTEGRRSSMLAHVPDAFLVVTQVSIKNYSLCMRWIRVLIIGQREELKIVLARDLVHPIRNKTERDAFQLPIVDVANQFLIAGTAHNDEMLFSVEGRTIQRMLKVKSHFM